MNVLLLAFSFTSLAYSLYAWTQIRRLDREYRANRATDKGDR